MNDAQQAEANGLQDAGGGASGPVAKIVDLAERIPMDLTLLLARLGLAGVFFKSGQTKVDGWTIWEPNTGAMFLFKEEYKLPLLPPDLAATMASLAEHILPVLLVLGLLTRLSALALLGMTAVITLFVFPNFWEWPANPWPDHAMWAALCLLLMAKGGGRIAVDRLFGPRF